MRILKKIRKSAILKLISRKPQFPTDGGSHEEENRHDGARSGENQPVSGCPFARRKRLSYHRERDAERQPVRPRDGLRYARRQQRHPHQLQSAVYPVRRAQHCLQGGARAAGRCGYLRRRAYFAGQAHSGSGRHGGRQCRCGGSAHGDQPRLRQSALTRQSAGACRKARRGRAVLHGGRHRAVHRRRRCDIPARKSAFPAAAHCAEPRQRVHAVGIRCAGQRLRRLCRPARVGCAPRSPDGSACRRGYRRRVRQSLQHL